jgi:hypothetical protein
MTISTSGYFLTAAALLIGGADGAAAEAAKVKMTQPVPPGIATPRTR